MAELFANVGRRSGKLLFTANRICELINNHQTVAVCDVDGMHEVAPIVRCKDCKYGLQRINAVCEPCIECHKSSSWHSHDLNWFCADGEEKET